MISRVAGVLLWLLAILVAVLVYRRMRRGRTVVLTGRFSPRLVRMVAIVLVMLGVGCEERRDDGRATMPLPHPGAADAALPAPAAQEPQDPLPATVTAGLVAQWVKHQQPVEQHESSTWWPGFKLAFTRAMLEPQAGPVELQSVRAVSPAFAQLLASQTGAPLDESQAPSTDLALRALEQMESHGVYDMWLAACLWRTIPSVQPGSPEETAARADLLARLHLHARVANTLVKAHAQIKPVMKPPPVWRSKGAPREEWRSKEVAARHAFARAAAEMLEIARRLHATTDAGPWVRDGVVRLSLREGSRAPLLVRAGRRRAMGETELLQFGRLDLLESAKDAGSTLEHDTFGRIEIPAGRQVGAWQLHQFLPPEGAERVRAAVKAALGGDEEAALAVERALPLAHHEVRGALAREATAAGASRLRLILALWDDAPMPVIAQPR